MTPHKLEHILDDIASEEIADDMNLWPDIHARLETIPAPRPRSLLGLSRAVAALAVILFAGTVYAVYQAVARNGDPGIQAVSELITEIDQTLWWGDEDVNVTLNWAYADGHRIAIGWTVDAPATLDLSPWSVTLLDRNGTPFKDAAFMYGGGGGGGGGGDRMVMSLTNSFDATGITGSPESLPLTVHFTFGDFSLSEALHDILGGGPQRVRPFRLMFDFEVPFIPAEPVDGEFTAEANGVVMTVRDLTFAPSSTLGKLCYEIPEDNEMYWPIIAQPEGEAIDYVTFSGDPESVFVPSEIYCVNVAILAPADPETGVVSFAVDWLQTYAPKITAETVADLQARVQEAGLGYAITYVPPEASGGVADYHTEWLLDHSEEADRAGQSKQLLRLTAETLHSPIDGPWTFEIDVK